MSSVWEGENSLGKGPRLEVPVGALLALLAVQFVTGNLTPPLHSFSETDVPVIQTFRLGGIKENHARP